MNAITYFEVAGPDSARLADFYASVFGWKPTPGPLPNYFHLRPMVVRGWQVASARKHSPSE